MFFFVFFFFFKQKTAYEMRISDWSSDVCSSDLLRRRHRGARHGRRSASGGGTGARFAGRRDRPARLLLCRSDCGPALFPRPPRPVRHPRLPPRSPPVLSCSRFGPLSALLPFL